jgi:DNA-binding MarR family transcriptional regulator
LQLNTTPDTGAILEQLGRLIRGLTRLTGGADDGPAMTATQRIALVELSEAAAPLRLNDLADRMGTSAPTASRAVDALDDLGFVARAIDPTDRRAVSIELTAAGRALVDERKARSADAFEHAGESLSPDERATLLDLLERMADAITHPRA